jgi:hypothetical protein
VLEAIFLHGLKATFLGRLSSRLGSEFSPRMPEPSFWTFALVFSHKQVLLPEPQSLTIFVFSLLPRWVDLIRDYGF